MHQFSLAARLEKNKMASTAPFLLLVEVRATDTEIIRLVNNNEDIVWGGQEWIAFPVKPGDISDDTKSLPQVNLLVSNVNGLVQSYLEEYDGLTDREVVLRIVHAAHLDLNEAEIEETYTIQKVDYDEEWVTFVLGGENIQYLRFPPRRYMQRFCAFKYKSVRCGAVSSLPTCDKTLQACRDRNNAIRFGGEPGMLAGGLYAN
jgi:lambda family phage minor tail protein L